MIIDMWREERASKTASDPHGEEVYDIYGNMVRSHRGYNGKPLCECGQETQTFEEASRSAKIWESVYGNQVDVYLCAISSDETTWHVAYERIIDFAK
jgi:hypothetical protein